MFSPLDAIFTSPKDNNAATFLYKNHAITWQVFCCHVAKLAAELAKLPHKELLLYCEDTFLFTVGFFAILQANKAILMPQNIQQHTINEFADNGLALLTDLELNYNAHVIQIKYYEDECSYNNLMDINTASPIVFSTSGSTGKPKKIYKTLLQLSEEVNELEELWGKDIANNSLFVSTVSHQHIYGLLFRLLWPLCRGDIIHSSLTFNPEALISLATKNHNLVLISSPAFLKRVAVDEIPFRCERFAFPIKKIFSSGGALNVNTAKKTRQIFHVSPLEILGSTETGGIAYRMQDNSSDWQTFPRVQIKTDDTEQLFVKSPYIYEGDYIATGDTIELLDSNHFILKERVGRIVKIEEKRVSLSEIEARLNSSEWVKNSRALIFDMYRQVIGAVVILTDEGNRKLEEVGKRGLNIILQKYLLQYFEPVVIPRKWRFAQEININSQGKILDAELKELFK